MDTSEAPGVVGVGATQRQLGLMPPIYRRGYSSGLYLPLYLRACNILKDQTCPREAQRRRFLGAPLEKDYAALALARSRQQPGL